ncbi:MAG: glycosyltransferase, partial [Oscillospiraceae bacterium]
TMYDDYLYYLVPEKLVPTLRTISHKYFKYLSNHASALTGPSSKCEEFFKECGATKSVSVVPNPVELDVFNPTHVNKTRATMLRQSYNVAADDTLIAFCGRLGREKSVDVLLNNWSKHVLHDDKLKLMILGEGPCLEELKEQAKSLNIDDSVVFVGRVEHEKLPDYYGACDLYVTASLSDTNSISMKEAMAIGLPVVHIYDPLNAGQVTNGINGFIYKDSDEMYKIFKRFQSMSEIEKLDLKNSVVNSVKKFGCEALAKYLIDVYQEAIIKKKYEVK